MKSYEIKTKYIAFIYFITNCHAKLNFKRNLKKFLNKLLTLEVEIFRANYPYETFSTKLLFFHKLAVMDNSSKSYLKFLNFELIRFDTFVSLKQ